MAEVDHDRAEQRRAWRHRLCDPVGILGHARRHPLQPGVTQLRRPASRGSSTGWSGDTSCTARPTRDRRRVMVYIPRAAGRSSAGCPKQSPPSAKRFPSTSTNSARPAARLARRAGQRPALPRRGPRGWLRSGRDTSTLWPRGPRWLQGWCRTTDLRSWDSTLQHGDTLKDAKLAYKTFGGLNSDKSNAIVYPTWYSGFHWDNEWLVGEDMALDPAVLRDHPEHARQWALSSPSDTPPPHDRRTSRTSRSTTRSRHSTSWSPSTSGSRRCRLSPAGRWARGRPTSGRSAPRHGAARRPVLRLLQDQRAQLRLPRGREGGPDRRQQFPGRLLRCEAGGQPAQDGPRVRRLGVLAGLLLGSPLHRHGPLVPAGHRPGVPGRSRTSSSSTGRATSSTTSSINDLLSMLWTWQYGDIGQSARVQRQPRQGVAVDQGQAHRHAS